ncbi:hypothetical protein CBR_g39126 [Chara braunii]|uniref:FAS1 domain-containing protein n=1 Tax=Chara braunii TaxID=69332 RepID=A0A388LQY7_CHABU|nr:hypothetical protein CBR_g39126 [Chara braunii]|eukprot:GBG84748.1 hypothetical protein CBR_g39126 [Chara braunii]
MAAAMSAAMAVVFSVLLVLSPVLVEGNPGLDLLEAIKGHQRLHRFHQALVTTGFSNGLNNAVNAKPTTIFAPVDDAVDTATATYSVSWDCLTQENAGKAALKETLKHHVVEGAFHTLWNLTKTNQVIPADGFPIEAMFDKATHVVILDGYVHVVEPEAIVMENAIVHLIDGVIVTESNYAQMVDVCGQAQPSASPSLGFASGL